jgi:sulfate adenylyltransferase subunit 2
MLLALGPWTSPREGVREEEPFEAVVRYRTVGDMTCTAAVESEAATPAEIIVETALTRVSERGATRADDRISDAAMEDRKREGYF